MSFFSLEGRSSKRSSGQADKPDDRKDKQPKEEEMTLDEFEESPEQEEKAWDDDFENQLAGGTADDAETESDLVAQVVEMGRRAWQGREFLIYKSTKGKRGELLLLVQRMATDKRECDHCGKPHPFLVVQRIASRPRRQGHGSECMRGLIDATHEQLGGGVQLQSCITEGSKAMARKLGMTQCRYDPGSFVMCKHEKVAKN